MRPARVGAAVHRRSVPQARQQSVLIVYAAAAVGILLVSAAAAFQPNPTGGPAHPVAAPELAMVVPAAEPPQRPVIPVRIVLPQRPVPAPAAPARRVLPPPPPAPEPPRESLGTFRVTAYCPCARCCGRFAYLPASKRPPISGPYCAADLSVLPLGTKIHIEGVGWRTVSDTGSDIRGKSIDVLMSSHWRARQFGKRWLKVEVRASND